LKSRKKDISRIVSKIKKLEGRLRGKRGSKGDVLNSAQKKGRREKREK